MNTTNTRSTGAIMTAGKNKRFREMTIEEQIIFYQNKASQLKKKQEQQKSEHHRNIGRIFEKVFGDVTGTDEEIEYVFSNMMKMISESQKSRKQNAVQVNPSSTKAQTTTTPIINTAPAATASSAPQGPIKD